MRAWIFAAACLALGCGGGSNGGAPSLGVDAGHGDAAASDAADAFNDAVPLDAASTSQTGALELDSNDLSTLVGGTIAASFLTLVQPGSTGCSVESFGPCTVTTCSGTGTPPVVTASSAGSIAYAAPGGISLSLTPNADASYDPLISSTPLWHAGDRVSLTAQGAAVPAFTVDAVAPTPVPISAPAFDPSGAPPTFHRTDAIDVAWTPGSADEVVTVLFVADPPATVRAQCVAAAKDGALHIDAAPLSLMPAGPTSFRATSSSFASANAGAWKVDVTLASDATFSDGSDARARFFFD